MTDERDEEDTGGPLIRAARTLADEVLAPQAAAVDAGRVPRSHLDALGAAGLLGLQAPRSAGGAQAPAAVARAVEEILAGADLATWFVQAQHHGVVQALASTHTCRQDELLADLAAGRRVAGIAFSHLRRRPDRPVRALPDGEGWRLDGTAPWYTGWGINDVALVGGVSDDDEIVFAVLKARPGPRLTASAPMETAALRAAATVTLTLDDYPVPPGDIVSVGPAQAWRARDSATAANVRPAVFGVTGTALRLLETRGRERGEPEAVDAARRLGERADTLRKQAYRLLDEVPPDREIGRRLELRAQAHQVLVDATTALVISGAGGSMALGAPAQRLAREALFLLVQAQTADSRRVALRGWGERRGTGAKLTAE